MSKKKKQKHLADEIYQKFVLDCEEDEENSYGPDILKKLPLFVDNKKGWCIQGSDYIGGSITILTDYAVICSMLCSYDESLLKKNKRGTKETRIYASDIKELVKLSETMLDYGTYYVQFDDDTYGVASFTKFKSSSDNDDEAGYMSNNYITYAFYIVGKNWSKYQKKYQDLYSYYKKAEETSDNKMTRIAYASNIKPAQDAVFKSFDYLIMKDKEKYIKYIDNWVKNIPVYFSYGMTPKLSILLYGAPGTGKSSFCKAVADHLKIDTVKVFDPFYFSNMDKNPEKYKNRYAKFVCALDDIDCFCKSRTKDDSPENGKVLSRLLEFLDNPDTFYIKVPTEEADGTVRDLYYPVSIVIATTNYYDKLDDAVKRYGRFDLQIEMHNFDYNSAVEMAKTYNVNIDDVIGKVDKKTFTITPAKLQALCMSNIDNRLKEVK